MHYPKTFLAGLLLTAALVGCDNCVSNDMYAPYDTKETKDAIESDTTLLAISNAAYGYLDAVANFRFDDAEPYCTSETREVSLEFFKKVASFMSQDTIDAKLPAYVTIKGVTLVDDTTANVAYRKKDNRVDHTDTLEVLLRDGQWLTYAVVEIDPTILYLINNAKKTPDTITDTTALLREAHKRHMEQGRSRQ